MSIGAEAFAWGVVSAVSLPLGAVIGILWKPKSKINSAFMAFGAGALLFALSVELFGHVPHHVHSHGMWALIASIVGALCGGALFDALNQILNNQGAFLRSFSNAKKYVGKLKMNRAKALIEELSEVEVLRNLPPEKMAMLVQRVRKRQIKEGTVIFHQDDAAEEMFFIISGKVSIQRHVSDADIETLAELGKKETFGEMGLLTGQSRTADAIAKEDTYVYTIDRHDFQICASGAPELQSALEKLVSVRVNELALKDEKFSNKIWTSKAMDHLNQSHMPVTSDDIQMESQAHGGANNAAMAIWLGILIDAIPESLVIGMLAMSSKGMSLAFVAGVFLANLPEAMSSSVTMKKNGMKVPKILIMWGSLAVATGIGAYLGTVFFSAEPTGHMFYVVLGIEGLAAGAMLTMIAETMLPEAFEQGGSIVGLSTLLGFLAALSVAAF